MPLESGVEQLAPEKRNYYITQSTFHNRGRPKLELAEPIKNKQSILETIAPIRIMDRSLCIKIHYEYQFVAQQEQWIQEQKQILDVLKTHKISYIDAETILKQFRILRTDIFYPFSTSQRRIFNKSQR
jgi:hypothetical protein